MPIFRTHWTKEIYPLASEASREVANFFWPGNECFLHHLLVEINFLVFSDVFYQKQQKHQKDEKLQKKGYHNGSLGSRLGR